MFVLIPFFFPKRKKGKRGVGRKLDYDPLFDPTGTFVTFT